MYTPGDPANDTKRVVQSAPFIKAFNVPEELWGLTKKCLDSGALAMKSLRAISWSLPKDSLKISLENLASGGNSKLEIAKRKREFDSNIILLKFYQKLIPAIHKAKNLAFPNANFGTDEEFISKFKEVYPLQSLSTDEMLKKAKGKGFLNDEFLTSKVTEVCRKLLVEKEFHSRKKTGNSIFTTVSTVNLRGVKSQHGFRCCDSLEVIHQLAKLKKKIGLIVIDPPFGILENVEWGLL